jgi:hypothetical protein
VNPKLTDGRLSLACGGGPLWALSSRWKLKSKRLFSPSGALKTAACFSEIGYLSS